MDLFIPSAALEATTGSGPDLNNQPKYKQSAT
jgi:hypothetical protein